MDVVISNVTLVDNGMGVMPLIFAPASVSHMYADKKAQIQVRGGGLFCFPEHHFKGVVTKLKCSLLFPPRMR